MIRSIVVGAVALLLPVVASTQDRGAPPVVMSDPSAPIYSSPVYSSPDYASTPRGYDMRSSASHYQRPGYGSTLPRQWMAPAYFLGNFDDYDLPVPAAGFGWSRYYDDAVLTDRWGRVYDVRHDFGRDERARRGHRRGHRRDYARGYGYSMDHGGYNVMQPHWDMGYYDGRGTGYGYGQSMTGDCGCGETVTTTTRTTGASRPVRTQTVSYETVRVASPRRVVQPAPRGKYVRVAR